MNLQKLINTIKYIEGTLEDDEEVLNTINEKLAEEERAQIDILFKEFSDTVTETFFDLNVILDSDYDVFFRTYSNLSIEDYEEIRKKALGKIVREENIFEKYNIAYQTMEELSHSSYMLAFSELFYISCKIKFVTEVVKKMLEKGISFEEASSWFSDIPKSDIYEYAKKMNIPLDLTTEDIESIQEEIERRKTPMDIKRILNI